MIDYAAMTSYGNHAHTGFGCPCQRAARKDAARLDGKDGRKSPDPHRPSRQAVLDRLGSYERMGNVTAEHRAAVDAYLARSDFAGAHDYLSAQRGFYATPSKRADSALDREAQLRDEALYRAGNRGVGRSTGGRP